MAEGWGCSHTHIHTHAHTRMHTHAHTNIHTHTYARTRTHMTHAVCSHTPVYTLSHTKLAKLVVLLWLWMCHVEFTRAFPWAVLLCPAPSDSGRTGEVLVNDTVTADPVFSVPLNIPNLGAVGLPGPSLSICFELRGRDNTLFNLVSDQCLSVNAHYTPVNNTSFRIIDNVAIRAAGNSRMCHNIDVSRMSCNATVNGTLGPFDFDGINVRTYAERIRVSVPNCDEQKVVVYFYCARSNLTESGISTEANFFRVRVVRGLNFGHRDSHGIIGECHAPNAVSGIIIIITSNYKN